MSPEQRWNAAIMYIFALIIAEVDDCPSIPEEFIFVVAKWNPKLASENRSNFCNREAGKGSTVMIAVLFAIASGVELVTVNNIYKH